jgi:hypothetical protein
LTFILLLGIFNSSLAQSPAEKSVRNWYNALLKLDLAGTLNFWVTDHKDFIYFADGMVNKKIDFLNRMIHFFHNTKKMLKADILEGYRYKISENAESYTSRVLLEGLDLSGKLFSLNVTATFVLIKINNQWQCVQCSASHVQNQNK